MIKHEFVFNAPKQTVISHLMNGVIEAKSFELCFYEEDAIYGKLRGDRILLYHGIRYKSAFRPLFSARIINNGKTVIKGFWRLPIFSALFMMIWFGNLITVSVLSLVSGFNILLFAAVVLFAAFGVLMTMSGFFFERNRMKKVIEHIEKAMEYINNGDLA